MTVKSGIKALAMLSSLALALVFVSGCTEETPTDTAKPNPPAISTPKGTDKAPAAPAPTKTEEKK